MYGRILVGVDGSKISTKALETAARLAAQDKADLFVFHAIQHHYHLPLIMVAPGLPYQSSYSVDTSDQDLHESFVKNGTRILEEAKQKIKAMSVKLASEADFRMEMYQAPAEYAADFARNYGIDLIVIGCKGHHTRARRTLMGTVATKLLNDAPCQVLVVK
ncbi:MAG TPA: universal stress protein [Candidatus Lokiarchaeia archaeon]|nr:universal stress protein [Candidatus Lokiarchaeia archaeon]